MNRGGPTSDRASADHWIARVQRPGVIVAPALALITYLIMVPPVPDLAAQSSRAEMVRQSGLTVWWPGWFGGLDLPTYSCVTPAIMALLGAPMTGALASSASIAIMHVLLKPTLRPTAASATFAVIVMCNLFGGRITFLVGTAIGLAAVFALTRDRPVICALLGAFACLTSPLAALFLGIVAVAVALTDTRLRRCAAVLAATVAGTALTLYLLFSGGGVMPTPAWQMLLSMTCVAIVAAVCPSRTVRVGSALLMVSLFAAIFIPSAVGLNLTRMAWLLGAPLIVAYARMAHTWVLALMALTIAFPVIDASQQVTAAQDESARKSYYQPLLVELERQAALDPSSRGQRVEVLEPQTKGAARYVALEVPIARGWDRQADRAHNELFYNEDELLNPASYHAWLDEMAVGWVAVPATTLDHASKGEKHLIDDIGLPYLERIWTTEDWRLYRVTTAKPLAPGADVVADDHGEITLRVPESGAYPIQIRWSKHLQVDPAVPTIADGPEGACLAKSGAWTVLHVPAAGDYTIASDFKPLPFGGSDNDTCLRVGSP